MLGGKIETIIFSPSKGASGIMLNNIKMRFIDINSTRNCAGVGIIPRVLEKPPLIETMPSLNGIAARIASKKFDIGPASETHNNAEEDRFSKAYGLTGTGLAHPNPAKININDPIGSKWTIGFKDSLPYKRGVSSPNCVAVHACANSWIVKATSRTMIREIKTEGSRLNNRNDSRM